MKKWYKELFENYANNYEKEVFTQGTIQETDFLESLFKAGSRVLDIGCGTGRHSIELASRGFDVTGIDLSENMLQKAQEHAAARAVNVSLMQKDARSLAFNEEFDYAIMLCEGAFCLMETDEMDDLIIQNAFNALKPGGTLVFTCLNALFPLKHSTEQFLSDNLQGSSASNRFDLGEFRDYSVYETPDDDGNMMKLQCNERFYTPPELKRMLRYAGFSSAEVFACKVGEFSIDRPVNMDDYELLAVAVK